MPANASSNLDRRNYPAKLSFGTAMLTSPAKPGLLPRETSSAFRVLDLFPTRPSSRIHLSAYPAAARSSICVLRVYAQFQPSVFRGLTSKKPGNRINTALKRARRRHGERCGFEFIRYHRIRVCCGLNERLCIVR